MMTTQRIVIPKQAADEWVIFNLQQHGKLVFDIPILL